MSDDDKGLAADILMAGATGKLSEGEVGAMLSVLGGAPVLRDPCDPATGKQAIHNTLDADGDVLAAGEVYLLDERRVMVLREEFGGGNVVDTYYRLFYLTGEFEEKFIVANAAFRGGLFGKRTYQTRLRKVPKENVVGG